jgi:uncharacterized protein YxjI
MAQQLQSSPQLGIFPQFCAQQQMTLVMKEKVFSFSGDDFSVKDQFGNVVIRCEGKALSWSDKKRAFPCHTRDVCAVLTRPTTEFSDAAGNHLFDLKNKHFHIHKTLEAEDPAGNVLMTVKGKFSLFGTWFDGRLRPSQR